jgi:hypothetical protein
MRESEAGSCVSAKEIISWNNLIGALRTSDHSPGHPIHEDNAVAVKASLEQQDGGIWGQKVSK